MGEMTRLLSAVERGDPKAAEILLPLVYEELRKLAGQKMAAQPAGQTLQPTALVHEAYLRLVLSENQDWSHRTHFFAAAAEAMRHILVDNARRKKRPKHGGELLRVDVADFDLAATSPDDRILLVHDVLDRLEAEDPVKARIVKLHFFAGLAHAETAKALGLSEKTVRRHWNLARMWLYEAIRKARD